MYYQKITVSPADATKYLATSMHNRPLKYGRVNAIADDIINGKWSESPSPIVFDTSGHLIDGQHRMAAIARAGKSVTTWACYDCDISAVIDRGIPRSTGDALYMRGVLSKGLSTASVIAVVRKYTMIMENNARRYWSDDYVADFILENKDALESCMRITSLKGESVCKNAGFRTAIFAAIKSGANIETLERFVYVVNTGFMSSVDETSAVVLRTALLNNKGTGFCAVNHICAITQTALRDFISKTPRTKKYGKICHYYINNAEEA